MSDQELLYLAAKALWLPLCPEWDAASEGILIGIGDGDLEVWNPLAIDGEAMRLMIYLNLVLKECCNSEECYPQGYEHKKVIEFFSAGKDRAEQFAAARRAIVRAAAKIGEKLP